MSGMGSHVALHLPPGPLQRVGYFGGLTPAHGVDDEIPQLPLHLRTRVLCVCLVCFVCVCLVCFVCFVCFVCVCV